MRSRLVMINIPSSNSEQSRALYEHLLGIDFARSLTEKQESYHAPIAPGVQLTLNPRAHEREGTTTYFAVHDLKREVAALERLGAKVVVKPSALPVHPAVLKAPRPGIAVNGAISGGLRSACSSRVAIGEAVSNPPVDFPAQMGAFAVLRDPDNNLIGLMQLDPGAERFFNSQVTQQQLAEHGTGLQLSRALLEFEGKEPR